MFQHIEMLISFTNVLYVFKYYLKKHKKNIYTELSIKGEKNVIKCN